MAHTTVITIGNFDGVHLGHRRILEAARQRADADGALVAVLTFDPHPATVLRPERQPPRIMSRDAKIHTLHDAGADRVVILEPTEQLLGLAPDVFIRKLVSDHHPVAIVEGPGFRFGKNRSGGEADLKRFGEEHGFQSIIVDPVDTDLDDQLVAPVSSSLIRWLISHGRVHDAWRCMLQPHALSSRIIAGEKRGRTIGVPTANLDMQPLEGYLLPLPGVYAGIVELLHGPAHPAAISVGVKPTFSGHNLTVEAHLIDYDGDLYGHRATFRFHRWVRDQQRFPSIRTLQAQLRRDIDHVRQWHHLGLLDRLMLEPEDMKPRHA